MTKASGVGSDEGADRLAQPAAWWVWVATVERDGTTSFLYGCAAQTNRAPIGWKGEGRSVDLADGATLHMSEHAIAEQPMRQLRDALQPGNVLPNLLPGLTIAPTRVRAVRQVIQDSLGHSAVRARLHYTLPHVDALLGDDGAVLDHVLDVLQAELNLPFKGDYATRLGNFEVFELGDWLNGPRPFLVEGVRDFEKPGEAPEALVIRRTQAFAREEHMAHLVARAAGDVVLDRLIRLPANEPSVRVAVPEQLDGIELRIFDRSGETLIHHESSSFINRIGLVMAMAGPRMTIEDRLSDKAKQGGPALARRASQVESYSPERSQVGAPDAGSWRAFVDNMREIVAARLPQASEDRWFPRGVEGEVESIAHLARLLDGGATRSAILADPWFGAEELQRFALRIGSRGVDLTIVTGWAATDPDTGQPLDPGRSPTEQLEAALRAVRHLLNPRIAVVNLADGKAQAFHDRYLVLYPHEGAPKVLMLSNSINKLAGRWPVCMSLLAPDVSREVRRYVEGLRDGKDVARARDLDVTLRWPGDAA